MAMSLTWLSDDSEVSNASVASGWDWDDSLALWDDGLNEVLGRVVDGVVGRRQATVDKSSTADSVRRLLRGEDVESVRSFLRNVDHVGFQCNFSFLLLAHRDGVVFAGRACDGARRGSLQDTVRC